MKRWGGTKEFFFVCHGYLLVTPILKNSDNMRANFHSIIAQFYFLLVTFIFGVYNRWKSLLLEFLYIHIGVSRCVMAYCWWVGLVPVLSFNFMPGRWFKICTALFLLDFWNICCNWFWVMRFWLILSLFFNLSIQSHLFISNAPLNLSHFLFKSLLNNLILHLWGAHSLVGYFLGLWWLFQLFRVILCTFWVNFCMLDGSKEVLNFLIRIRIKLFTLIFNIFLLSSFIIKMGFKFLKNEVLVCSLFSNSRLHFHWSHGGIIKDRSCLVHLEIKYKWLKFYKCWIYYIIVFIVM